MNRAILVLASLLTFAGCASVGQKIDPASVEKIHKGQTTRSEVIALLGPPMSSTVTSEGKEILMWIYAHSSARGASYIPVVGLFAGGVNANSESVQVVIGTDKLVENFTSHTSVIDSRMGN